MYLNTNIFLAVSKCPVASYTDILWARHATAINPFVSADVRGGGRLRDEPKECLRRRLNVRQPGKVLNGLN